MDSPFVSQMMTGARLFAVEPPAEAVLEAIRPLLKASVEEIGRDEDVASFGDADGDCSVEVVSDASGAEAKSGAASCAGVLSSLDSSED
jgi:hypothetical protein